VPTPAQEARNARARAEGYRNDYDRRIHDSGRIPASEPGEPARYRGHSGLSELLAELGQSRRRIQRVAPRAMPERDARGRYREVRVEVLYTSGRQRTFYLRGRSASQRSLRIIEEATHRPGSLRRVGEGEEREAFQAGVSDTGDEEEEEDYLGDDYYWDEDYPDDYYISWVPAHSLGAE
jgi:hypothetical protein